MKLVYKSGAIALFFVFMAGCITDIEIEIPEIEPRLVLSSALSPWDFETGGGKQNGVAIYPSRHIFDDSPLMPVTNATVKLYRNGLFFQDLPYDSENHLRFYTVYYPPLQGPMPGEAFRVEVSAPGFEPVYAETVIPSSVPVVNVEIERIAVRKPSENFGDEIQSRLIITFNDPPDENNFYEVVLSSVGGEFKPIYYHHSTSSNPFITSEPYYPNPLSENVFYPRTLLFSGNSFKGQECKIVLFYRPSRRTIEVDGSWVTLLPADILSVQLRNVSEDYYRHYTTLYHARQVRLEDGLFGVAEPINVYSNVTNGFGLFSSFYPSIIRLTLEEIIVE
jgi:hypothetical protein